MITKSNPFLRNDYYPDQNDIDELNTRINEVQSDVDLLAISVNEKTEAVNGRLNNLQNGYNESFETDALKANTADINVLNINVQATIKDLDAEDTYTENLIVNKPVQDLALRNPHLENATSVNGNFYEPRIVGGTLDNVQVENIQSFKAINIEANEVKANVANLNVLNAINIEADVFKANVADLNKVTANTVDLNILNADKVTANTIDLNALNAINVKANEVKADKFIGDFSAEPISSSAVVGYDENGRLIPIRASYDVSFPEGADYLKTDAQGIARKGISESEVVQSTNLIQAGAVQNMYDAVIANFNNVSDSFNTVNESFNDVNNHFNNVIANFNNVSNSFNSVNDSFNDVNNHFINIELNFNNVDNNFNDISNSFDSINNSFSTNYLTVNDNVVVNGNNFTHKGFDVTSMTVISEDEYNNLGADRRSQTFYMTTPNGNLYFHGIKFAATNVSKEYTAYVSLPDMAKNMASLERSTLTFISGNVVNTFVNNGAYVNIWELTSLGENVQNDTAPVGTRADTGSIVTNANKLYITNAASMYSKCTNLIDTFICNPALIIGAPKDYDPMEHCTDMSCMFENCHNFNQNILIPNSVTNMSHMFENCHNFNQNILIPNSVTNIFALFSQCKSLNQNIQLPSNAERFSGSVFYNCQNLNQNIQIPNSIAFMSGFFGNCRALNQNILIPNGAINISFMFAECDVLNQNIHIPKSVQQMNNTFQWCANLNQNILIPNGVERLEGAFSQCAKLNQNILIPPSVHCIRGIFAFSFAMNQDIYIYSQNIGFGRDDNMNLAFASTSIQNVHIPTSVPKATTNYMYNCLVNGKTGITFTADRIFNDLPVDIDHWPPENV